MVTTSAPAMQYNESTQIERVSVFCKKSRKLLARVSLTGEWPAELQQWLWCKGCHMEHLVTKEHIEEARAQDARTAIVNH